MITHKFREVMAFADEVTVLRRGRLAGSGARRRRSRRDAMAEMMIGEQRDAASAPRARSAMPAQPRARARRLCALDDDTACRRCDGVNLEVQAGEIVGIAGVSGNGQRELVEVLAGQRDASGGEIRIDGERFDADARGDATGSRSSACPRSRCRTPASPRMSVAENMAFRDFDQPPFAAGGWWLSPRPMREQAARADRELSSQDAVAGRADRRPLRRQRAARGAGARAVAARSTC